MITLSDQMTSASLTELVMKTWCPARTDDRLFIISARCYSGKMWKMRELLLLNMDVCLDSIHISIVQE